MSAKSLEGAFEAAVRHYRYNHNAANMTHLKSLERYLGVAGSDRAFQDIRYWELTQSLDAMLLSRVYLAIHIELLHALSEILLARQPIGTVANRVERTVQNAMRPAAALSYSPGLPRNILSARMWSGGRDSRHGARLSLTPSKGASRLVTTSWQTSYAAHMELS